MATMTPLSAYVTSHPRIISNSCFKQSIASRRHSSVAVRVSTTAESAAPSEGRAPIVVNEDDPIPFISDLFTNQDTNPDAPTEGYSSISDASEALKAGKFIVLVDLVEGRSVGYMTMAASMLTPDILTYVDRYCTSDLYLALYGADIERLQLPAKGSMRDETAISVDEKSGAATGASVENRARTVRTLMSKSSTRESFSSPGHVFPLCYQGSGKRAGTPEAALDLITMNRLPQAAVIFQLGYDPKDINPRLPAIQKFAKEQNLPLLAVTDVNRYFAETTLHNLTVVNWIMRSLQDEKERLQKETGSSSTEMKVLVAERDRMKKEAQAQEQAASATS